MKITEKKELTMNRTILGALFGIVMISSALLGQSTVSGTVTDADGNPMISYDFGPQTDDISYGRNPDGSDTWEYFLIPTPGESNVIENLPPGPFSLIYPENNDTLVIDLNNLNDSTVFFLGRKCRSRWR